MERKLYERHLITRGNLDGIISAAVFLNRFPTSAVSFVTSPTTAAKELERNTIPHVCLADVSLTPELAEVMRATDHIEVDLVDHHLSQVPKDLQEQVHIDLSRSAAGSLHRWLGAPPEMDDLVALADFYELSETSLTQQAVERYGLVRLERESTVLDFSWRRNVEDDAFRLLAAGELSAGQWPSEIPAIYERYQSVLQDDCWSRALRSVRGTMETRGPVGVLSYQGRHKSLHGFGSKAMIEVAKEKGCRYALMLNGGDEETVVSLRAVGRRPLHLGRFIEDFTIIHGFSGGGHPASAGARIPTSVTSCLIDELSHAAC